MNRTEAETIHEEVAAMKAAEAFVEAIDEHRDETTTTEALVNVLHDALNDDIPGDLFDTIEAIAMETLDRIRAAALTTASQAALSAGIHDYQPPAAKPRSVRDDDDGEEVCGDGCVDAEHRAQSEAAA